jgi:hypothetical protein
MVKTALQSSLEDQIELLQIEGELGEGEKGMHNKTVLGGSVV